MMICPHTKEECGLTECSSLGCLQKQCAPPPPTLAEINRLIEDLIDAEVAYYCDGEDHEKVNGKRAALIAAYQRLGVN